MTALLHADYYLKGRWAIRENRKQTLDKEEMELKMQSMALVYVAREKVLQLNI